MSIHGILLFLCVAWMVLDDKPTRARMERILRAWRGRRLR